MHARHHFLSSPTSPPFNLTQKETSVADSLSRSPSSGPKDGAAATLQAAMLENGVFLPSEVLNLSNSFSNN